MDYEVPCIAGKIKNRYAQVSVPGSKSITARALFISALASGTSTLYGAGLSDDCLTFINCLKSLGISVAVDGNTVTVKGCGGRLPVRSAEVFVGSAGTAARFITALLALSEGQFTVHSSEQMKKRPMGDLISALSALGARFEFLEKEGCFPFVVRGTSSPLHEVCVDIDRSSQFLSALMMAGVGAGLKINVVGSHGMRYVDMTADIMRSFGAEVRAEGGAYIVGGSYSAREYRIEPDISAACYFYAINRILFTQLSVCGMPELSMQGDMQFIKLMQAGFSGGRVDMSAFSDQALTMAAIAPYFEKPTHICGVEHIRGQECNRIQAILFNLGAMGVRCEEHADGVSIFPALPQPAKIRTFGDHRVAMSFAVTGLRAHGIVIEDAEVCAKTFAEYFTVLDGLVQRLTR